MCQLRLGSFACLWIPESLNNSLATSLD
jgi:hypothetical protein